MFDYIYADDVKAMQTIIIPKKLFSDPAYSSLSAEAKVLYSILLADSEENHFCSDYSISDICCDLCCSRNTAEKILKELIHFGLVYFNQNNMMIVNFEESRCHNV